VLPNACFICFDIESKWIKRLGHVECLGEMINAYKHLLEIRVGERSLEILAYNEGIILK
jgi:hypothetical protein